MRVFRYKGFGIILAQSPCVVYVTFREVGRTICKSDGVSF